ncbi:MAG: phosphate--AMP phosphotransferase, partial [Clostridiales bacterium]|nr:phosphate--AMP phosphotransferase [Clostridiales bacterium]
TAVIEALKAALRRKSEKDASDQSEVTDTPIPASECADDVLRTSSLQKVDLSLSLEREEYKRELKWLQNRIGDLHGEIYKRRIPVIRGFEGWDAGGKGGAIKRLTEKMDPRGYRVHPTSAANDIEKVHHYLWRFWNNVPKDGHIAIFDRTWYGRVMVERIEGFCTRAEWQRAYQEINEMEKQFVDHGAIVLKFWLQIDKDEQERRFKERMKTPEKQWKITDGDWRNREKWDEYEKAVDEMLVRTSTMAAPWIIVEGNNKYYARVKVLQTVVDAMEERLAKYPNA